MLKEAGRQFDPDVIMVFLEMENSFAELVRAQVFDAAPTAA
jgi:response regulator RpfG family c-di-GMP phosphodiesterase